MQKIDMQKIDLQKINLEIRSISADWSTEDQWVYWSAEDQVTDRSGDRIERSICRLICRSISRTICRSISRSICRWIWSADQFHLQIDLFCILICRSNWSADHRSIRRSNRTADPIDPQIKPIYRLNWSADQSDLQIDLICRSIRSADQYADGFDLQIRSI